MEEGFHGSVLPGSSSFYQYSAFVHSYFYISLRKHKQSKQFKCAFKFSEMKSCSFRSVVAFFWHGGSVLFFTTKRFLNCCYLSNRSHSFVIIHTISTREIKAALDNKTISYELRSTLNSELEESAN